MRRPTAVALGVPLLAALAVAGLVARPGPHSPAASQPPVGAAVTPRPGSSPDSIDPGRVGDLTWSPGPWGATRVAGHRLLIPASRTHGPLRTRGDGWATDYTPDPAGAAIALLRGPWFVFAAPPARRPDVVAAVLTAAAAAEPGPVNPAPRWAIPDELLTGLAGQDIRLLGAVATVPDPGRAVVEVYQRVTTRGRAVVVRSTHHLAYRDRQWLIEADYSDSLGQELPDSKVPATFTITGPGAGA